MRFMILVKASETSESGGLPDEELLTAQVANHEELANAGVLIDATG
jgi:hypothetical protein